MLLCEDLQLGRKVALKRVLQDRLGDETRARFSREARLTAGIRHPHVVPVFDLGVDRRGQLYIVYEFVRGRNLRDWTEQRGRPRPARALEWLRQLVGALAAAHQAGVVHRDLKPENVMIREGQALLCDFGLAREAGDVTRLTATGISVGTPLYMAREVALGESGDERSDQWSLAAMGYELLYGKRWRQSQDVPGLLEEIHRPPVPWRQDPRLGSYPDLDPLLARALDPDPEKRFPRVAKLGAALEQASTRAPPPRVSSGPAGSGSDPRGAEESGRIPFRGGRAGPRSLVLAGIGLALVAWGARGPDSPAAPGSGEEIPRSASDPEREALMGTLERSLAALRLGRGDPRGASFEEILEQETKRLSDPTAPLRLRRVMRDSRALEASAGATPEAFELLGRVAVAVAEVQSQWVDVERLLLDDGLENAMSFDPRRHWRRGAGVRWRKVSPEFSAVVEEELSLLEAVPPLSWSDPFLEQQLLLSSIAPAPRVVPWCQEAGRRVAQGPGGGSQRLLRALCNLLLGDRARGVVPVPVREELLEDLSLGLQVGTLDRNRFEDLGKVMRCVTMEIRRQDPRVSPRLLAAFDRGFSLFRERGRMLGSRLGELLESFEKFFARAELIDRPLSEGSRERRDRVRTLLRELDPDREASP